MKFSNLAIVIRIKRADRLILQMFQAMLLLLSFRAQSQSDSVSNLDGDLNSVFTILQNWQLLCRLQKTEQVTVRGSSKELLKETVVFQS